MYYSVFLCKAVNLNMFYSVSQCKVLFNSVIQCEVLFFFPCNSVKSILFRFLNVNYRFSILDLGFENYFYLVSHSEVWFYSLSPGKQFYSRYLNVKFRSFSSYLNVRYCSTLYLSVNNSFYTVSQFEVLLPGISVRITIFTLYLSMKYSFTWYLN